MIWSNPGQGMNSAPPADRPPGTNLAETSAETSAETLRSGNDPASAAASPPVDTWTDYLAPSNNTTTSTPDQTIQDLRNNYNQNENAANTAQDNSTDAWKRADTSLQQSQAAGLATQAASTNAYDKANDWLQTGGQSGALAARSAADVAGNTAGTARSMGLNAAQAAGAGGRAGAADYNNIYDSVYGTGAAAYNAEGGALGNQANNYANTVAGNYSSAGTALGNQAVGYQQVGNSALQSASNNQLTVTAQQKAEIGGMQAAQQATVNDLIHTGISVAAAIAIALATPAKK